MARQKIFISYSHLDKDIAKQVHAYLSDDYNVFLDESSIRGGDKWTKSIKNNIATCNFFVIIITRSSLKSPEVNKEVQEAIRQEKRIIPCKWHALDWRDVKWELAGFQGLEFEEKYPLARDLEEMLINYNDERLRPTSKTTSRKMKIPRKTSQMEIKQSPYILNSKSTSESDILKIPTPWDPPLRV